MSHHRVSGKEFRADAAWFLAPAEIWAIVEIGFGVICASLVPLKPLVKLLVPCLVEISQQIGSGVRSFRSRASLQVFKARGMTRLKLDPYAQMANSPPCAGNSDHTVERGAGVAATKDVLIMESYPDMQHTPEKVVLHSR